MARQPSTDCSSGRPGFDCQLPRDTSPPVTPVPGDPAPPQASGMEVLYAGRMPIHIN